MEWGTCFTEIVGITVFFLRQFGFNGSMMSGLTCILPRALPYDMAFNVPYDMLFGDNYRGRETFIHLPRLPVHHFLLLRRESEVSLYPYYIRDSAAFH